MKLPAPLMMSLLPALILSALSPATAVGDDVIVHEAHVHGIALLTLIQEGSVVAIELNSPAMNITGFEHYVGTDEQKEAVAEAIVLLEGGDALFTLNGGGCSLASTNADFDALTGEGDEDMHSHHSHDHHSHDHHSHDHHSHDHHDHHDQDDDQAHGQERHTDITVLFEYQCTDGNRLRSMDVMLSDVFPRIQTLDMQWITDRHQGKMILTKASAATISLQD